MLVVASVRARPQQEPQEWIPVKEITHYTTGEKIPVDVNNIDVNGCLRGPGGDAVCPQGAIGASGQDAAFYTGNVGHRGTGSNGNAAPVGADGRPVDPAAIAYANQNQAVPRVGEAATGDRREKR